MKTTKKLLIAALLAFGIAGHAQDTIYTFNGNSASASLWSDVSRWSLNGEPLADFPTESPIYVKMANSTSGASDSSLTINKATSTRYLYLYADTGIDTLNIYASNTGTGYNTFISFTNITSGTVNFAQYGSLGVNKVGFYGGYINSGVTLNVNGSFISGWGGTVYGTVNFNYSGSVTRLYGTGNVSVGDGVSLAATNSATTSSAFVMRGANSYVNIGSGASLSIASGFRTTNADISGAFTVSGAQYGYSDNSNNIAFIITGKGVFRSGSTLVQGFSDSSSARPYVSGSLYTYAAAGALNFAQAVQLSGGTVVMNSANSIATTIGDTTSTMFKISEYGNASMDGVSSGTIKIGEDADTGAAISVGKNTIASVEFYGASSLNLILKGNELEIDSIFQTDGTSGDISIILNDTETMYETLLIKDFMGLTDKDQVSAFFTASAGNVYVEYVNGTDSSDGYYINTAVPEPAEWAAIFGAIAIGLAIYRKRRM